MTPEDFRSMCNSLGFDVEHTVNPDDIDGERTPLKGTNSNGDIIYYRKALNGDAWVIDIDANGYTLDRDSFQESDYRVQGGELVIGNASGTRSSSGYGNTGFANAEFRLDGGGAEIVERH